MIEYLFMDMGPMEKGLPDILNIKNGIMMDLL